MSTVFNVYLVGTVAVILMAAVFEEEKYQNIQLGRKKMRFGTKLATAISAALSCHSSKMHLHLEESLSGQASNSRLQFSETDGRVY